MFFLQLRKTKTPYKPKENTPDPKTKTSSKNPPVQIHAKKFFQQAFPFFEF